MHLSSNYKLIALIFILFWNTLLFSQMSKYQCDSNYYYIYHKGSNSQFHMIEKKKKLFKYILMFKNKHQICKDVRLYDENGKLKLAVFLKASEGSINAIIEMKNDQANGMQLLFNKRGKVDIIADYKDGKLVNIIYYRKKRILKKFIKILGDDPVLTIHKEYTESE